MLVDTRAIKEGLYIQKQEALALLDRARLGKVRYAIEARLTVLDALFLWLDKCERKGVLEMTDLKLGELTTWEPLAAKDGIDQKIINDAKVLKKNFDAIKITVESVKWTTVSNRVYKLRDAGQIPRNIVPRRDAKGVIHLVYLDEPGSKRGK
jgi:hypothetical protein